MARSQMHNLMYVVFLDINVAQIPFFMPTKLAVPLVCN